MREFEPFVERILGESVKPYENLYARMDEMEEHKNNRFKVLLVPYIVRFTA